LIPPVDRWLKVETMSTDVLVLNTAVADFRHESFTFADKFAAQGGLAICDPDDMPSFSPQQLRSWVEQGTVTAGGPGNTAPLMAEAGLRVAVGVNLGKGPYDGLDAQGRFFHDTMTSHDIDMSAVYVHPGLSTGTTFIHKVPAGERGGIAYFPNANHDFDFERFKEHVTRLAPSIVYYMYSGLSRRGDANGGHNLAAFMRWCRQQGAIVIADCHTLTGSPEDVIRSGRAVAEYKLLAPLLPELDIFFTSSDEARMIENTLFAGRAPPLGIPGFLRALLDTFRGEGGRARLFGVTVKDGAYEVHDLPNGTAGEPRKIESGFMGGNVIDLVGAGDAFRAGLLSYIARNLVSFRQGTIDFAEAVQMGNLFASLFIKAPLGDRYCIKPFDIMLRTVRSGTAKHGMNM